MDSVNTLIE